MSRWTHLAPWRGPTENQGGSMEEVRGLVLHIAEGYFEGTISWQKNPTADVSSHFVGGRIGERAQIVDTDVTAWTQRAGNGHWLSVEMAGFTPSHPLHHPGLEKMTTQQIEFAAALLVQAHRQYGVPLKIATSPKDRGLGHHSMGSHPGYADDWGHADCPGPAMIAQKQAIVLKAIDILNEEAENMLAIFTDEAGTRWISDFAHREKLPVATPDVRAWVARNHFRAKSIVDRVRVEDLWAFGPEAFVLDSLDDVVARVDAVRDDVRRDTQELLADFGSGGVDKVLNDTTPAE